MKKILFLLMLVSCVNIHAQNVKSKAYTSGIYIFCGNELPKKFEYVIERKADTDNEFQTMAALVSPTNSADCKGRLMSLPITITANTNIDETIVNKVWMQCSKNIWLDSLYAYALDPRYQFAAGCAWFDDGVKAGSYTYRISKKERNDSLVLVREEKITYPSSSYNCVVAPVRFKPEDRAIIIHYKLSDTLNTTGLKIFRSKHKENIYSEVPVKLGFTKVNNQIVAEVTDATAAKGVTYSYVAVPFDGLGNMGKASDTLSIYNMQKAGDIGMIQSFDVKPNDEKHGVEINWKLKSDAGLTSLDIYRSDNYDGKYIKVTSLLPQQTNYFDDDKSINPAVSYYYYLVANASYGRSFPSARTPVILKGNNPNIIPPQNVNIARNGNIVTLTFSKVEPDTRGYYVYRAKGFVGKLEQLPKMLLSTDSSLTYTDTLPISVFPETYSYAVADINTSYNISSPSDRVNTQTSGNLPPINGVNALLYEGKVLVTWKDATLANPAVSSYKLYRTTLNSEGKETEAIKEIASIDRQVNSFTDSTIQAGMRYRYQVKPLGMESDEGSLSQWASIDIDDDLPLQPGQIVGYASGSKAVIKWVSPTDANASKIRLYRAASGEKITLLKEFNITDKIYEDASIEVGKTYFYMLSSVSKNNKESSLTDAVSVKLK